MTANLGPINDGKDRNFFTKFTVTNTDFGNDADVIVNIKHVQSFSLVNEGSVRIDYSFNGNVLHGDLTPSSDTSALFFDNRKVTKIWFRVASGSAVVRVEAWGV